uniref:Uncharacterized protein n=1 Tax=Phenylobacterium glaciei TaxID=2803784 RepID=A0A974P0E1_9CAUL|nr:hypothetical protein JKL49_15010 [Phenylobacterium glaciei]
MGEHARRYPDPLIPIMADGFVLYADDHRGHGYTAPPRRRSATSARTARNWWWRISPA